MSKIRLKGLITFIIYLQMASICFSQPVRLDKKISIEENALMVSGSFALLPTGNFIFTDIRDENNQIKIINDNGKIIKAWGKMGPGPEEFGGLANMDYQCPYLAIMDAGKRCIHIFETNLNKFRKIGDILAWEATDFIKLYDKSVLMGGYITSPKGKGYIVFGRDFSGHNTQYILPLEYKYGERSLSEYQKTRDKVSVVSCKGFADIYEDDLFYVSDVRVKVIKTNLRTKKIEIFGKEPKNFRALVLDKETTNELLQTQTGRKKMEDILNKFSFVSGIFVDKDYFGLIYLNREKKVGDELYFVAYVQIYDHSGKVLYEGQLEDFYTEENISPLVYQKGTGCLYLLGMTSSELGVKYVIYKYQIKL